MDSDKDLEYLNISLSVGKVLELAEQAKLLISEGKDSVSLAAWKNDRAVTGSPLYKGAGVNVWKNVKKASVTDVPSSVENI